MRYKRILTIMGALFLGNRLAWAQGQPQSASSLMGSNILNPNISVVGWFQGEAGRPHPAAGQEAEPPLQMYETELALQAVVDPYARGDFFVSFDNTGQASLEEGYITWFHLPGDLSARTGKFRSYFGAINRTHPHDTPFAVRPLVEQNYFGDGLSGEGGGLSYQIPIPWLYVNVDGEAFRPPAASDVPAFDRAQRNDLLYMGRLSSYYDITEEWNVLWGGSYAHGPDGQVFSPVADSSNTLSSNLFNADVTFRWKNPRRAIYRSFLWSTEFLWDRRDMPSAAPTLSRGYYSYAQYQFAQRWVAGLRYDDSGFPTDARQHEVGKLVYLSYSPTEFSHISLQGSHIKRADGGPEDLGYLRIIFNIGPHGAHPF
jgi:hypothetical protein